MEFIMVFRWVWKIKHILFVQRKRHVSLFVIAFNIMIAAQFSPIFYFEMLDFCFLLIRAFSTIRKSVNHVWLLIFLYNLLLLIGFDLVQTQDIDEVFCLRVFIFFIQQEYEWIGLPGCTPSSNTLFERQLEFEHAIFPNFQQKVRLVYLSECSVNHFAQKGTEREVLVEVGTMNNLS